MENGLWIKLKLLVKEINKTTFKLESHTTKKWELLRKRELEKQWKETLLYYLILILTSILGSMIGKLKNKS